MASVPQHQLSLLGSQVAMEPGGGGGGGGGGRLPVDVLGENEALQRFFEVQDVSGVLESSVAVDTSILEEYIANDMVVNSFMLPDSPPDSSSDPCSPPQIPDLHYDPHWSAHQQQHANQEVAPFQPIGSQHSLAPAVSSCRFKDRGSAPPLHADPPPTHAQLRSMGLTNTHVDARAKADAHASQRIPRHTPPSNAHHYLSPGGPAHIYTPPPPAPTPSTVQQVASRPALTEGYPPTPHGGTPHPGPCPCLPAPHSGSPVQQPRTKRRRTSDSYEGSYDSSPDTVYDSDAGAACNGNGVILGPYQLLNWEPYRAAEWNALYNSSYQTLPVPAYHVNTDKGFNFSAADEAFVCQKKNHFQVTVHVGVHGEPRYVNTPGGPRHAEYFLVKVFGVKPDSPSHRVTIEQSQSDRTKKPFHPLRVNLPGDKITKVTLGRLHFSETTANNMRKKGRPNPDQRYFLLVVGLYAAVRDESYLVTALMSEKIIVRASNPGQFETDGEPLWQRGAGPDSVVCQGRVGINTDQPDEALVVGGNAKVMGSVLHPSDRRAKHNIHEVDNEEQLRRITQMRIVEYDYKPEFASSMGIDHTHQTGIIAQEIKELLPQAVKEVGHLRYSDGEQIDNFLMVDKEQIFMENVGAVKQLCKLTDNLETRIKELEVWNTRLAKLKSLSGSLRSKGSIVLPNKNLKQYSSKHTIVPTHQKADPLKTGKGSWSDRYAQCIQHKVFQASVFTLLATMAFSVISITALYLLTLDEDLSLYPGNGSSVFPIQTTTAWTTVSPSPPPIPWPPAIDFSDILYCDEVYCCPSPVEGASSHVHINTTRTTSASSRTAAGVHGIPPWGDDGREQLFDKLRDARDWTNTTIQSFLIKENEQVIDSRYCETDSCGSGRYNYTVPVSPYVPVNMRVTLLMNSTELLVVYLCSFDETAACSSVLDINSVAMSPYPTNTQGEHEWSLHVSRLSHSSYHFRTTVAGQADCSTDRHYMGVLFTDYHFHFYRRCKA